MPSSVLISLTLPLTGQTVPSPDTSPSTSYSRVEPFGELVVGVFSKAGPAFVEAWVERVEHSGPGVQIGVALLRARHRTPEAFRADAETALREAYERKEDCVIVE